MSLAQKLKVAIWLGTITLWAAVIFMSGMALGMKIVLDRNTPAPSPTPVTTPEPGELWTL